MVGLYPRPSPSTIPRLDDNCQVYPASFPLHTTKDLAFSEKKKLNFSFALIFNSGCIFNGNDETRT